MPQLVKPTTVVREITTQTMQGEITVNLNLVLTIHVDQDGLVDVKATAEEKIPDFRETLPDWGEGEMLEFGKEVDYSKEKKEKL